MIDFEPLILSSDENSSLFDCAIEPSAISIAQCKVVKIYSQSWDKANYASENKLWKGSVITFISKYLNDPVALFSVGEQTLSQKGKVIKFQKTHMNI